MSKLSSKPNPSIHIGSKVLVDVPGGGWREGVVTEIWCIDSPFDVRFDVDVGGLKGGCLRPSVIRMIAPKD